MDSQQFIKQLNEVQELIKQENYKEAINLIEKLKDIEKNSNFAYNITHRLYQLDSNSRSLYNQQLIFNYTSNLSNKYKSIKFHELKQMLKENDGLNLSEDILRREIEILILRGLLFCRIQGDTIIFKSTK